MRRIRIIGLALVAVFAFSAVAAATASANHVWWVGGKALAEGKANGKAVKAELKAGTKFVLKGFIFGVEGNVECSKIKFGATPAAIIFNESKTGRDEGKIEFTECTGPSACGAIAEPIVTLGEKTELVEQVLTTKQKEEKVIPKIYDLFLPNGTGEAAKIKFAICGTLTIKGSTVAEIKPEGPSITKEFVFPKPGIKKVINWEGKEIATGLTSEGKEATFFGTAIVSLVSGEEFDVV